jgi:Flp pilus assembly protein TadD/TolB-like protein
LVILFLLNLFSPHHRRSSVPEEKHLAVLPLRVIDADRASQAFSDGLVETLTSKLTQFEQADRSMWIVPASELRASGIDSPSRARQALGVNLVITGSLQQNNGLMRLTLNLVDAVALRQLRSAVISENINASADFQDRAASEVARMLELELAPETRTRLAAGGTSHAAANEYYLQGRGFLQRFEQQANLDTAIGLFQKAIGEDNGFALAFAGLGESYWRKYELTRDPLLVKEAQDNCLAAAKLDAKLVPVYVTLGIINRGCGLYGEAVVNFKAALALDPVNSEALLGLAFTYQSQGKKAEAESTYRRVIELKPNYWAAVNSLGFFYAINGRWQQAEAMFQRVIALTPDNIRGYNNLGFVYQFQENTAMAKKMYEKSLAIRANPDAYSNLGTIFFFAGSYSQAAAMYEKGIALGMNDCQIWGNLGDAYAKLPEFKDKSRSAYQNAIRLADTQLQINPRDAQLRSSLALYCAKAGQSQNSLDEITRARELAASNVTVLINASLVYELAGRRAQALSALETFFALSGPKQLVEQEPLFAALRRDQGYAALLANAKSIAKQNK